MEKYNHISTNLIEKLLTMCAFGAILSIICATLATFDNMVFNPLFMFVHFITLFCGGCALLDIVQFSIVSFIYDIKHLIKK